MPTVAVPDDLIIRFPFLNDDLGELIARHDDEGPIIDVFLAPEDGGGSVTFALTPAEARVLAGQLTDIADAAQRAGWTPAVLADVREHYLPGASDEQIIQRLDQLTQRLGSSPLGIRPGTVSREAGRMLAAEAGGEVVDQVADVLDEAIVRLGEFRGAVDQLAGLRAAFAELRRFYQAESQERR